MSYHFILKQTRFPENVHFRLGHLNLVLFHKENGLFFIPLLEENDNYSLRHFSEHNHITLEKKTHLLSTMSNSLKNAFCGSVNFFAPKKIKVYFLDSEGGYSFIGLDAFKNETPFKKEEVLRNQSLSSSRKKCQICSQSPSFVSYQGMTISSLLEKVKPYLTEHRFKHSVSVATLCYEIANNNHINHPERAYIAGLLHDIGKRLDANSSKELMKGEFVEFLCYPDWSLHQFVGYVLSKRDFGINDPEILDAICFHCTGKAKMCPIGEILYSADKIDPLRGWDSGPFVEECLKNYHLGFLKTLEANKKFLKEKMGNDEIDCELSRNCYRYYLGEE